MATGIKKGLALIMIANLINLIIGLVNGFIIPKFLSVESYAMIKTFTLYCTYAGVFHLGYLDGMYLKYGGKDLEKVSPIEYGEDFWNVAIMQLFVSVAFLFFGIIKRDFVLSAFGVSLFFKNMASCFQMFFQATGEFKLYSRALNYGTILTFIVSLILVFIVKTDNYVLYISAQVFSSIVVTTYLGFLLNSKLGYFSNRHLNKEAFKDNIKSGFVLMIGNFSNNLFTSIDRWIVKIFMTTFYFASYSFAVSVDALITVFITPLYVTLYNEFCRNRLPERVKNIKKYVMLWGCIIVIMAFPAKWIIERYLDKYEASLSVLFILFSTQIIYAIIKGVYVNYFKSLKRQKEYFKQIMLMLVISIALGLILYFVFKSMLAVAFAAFIVAFFWLIINEIRFKELRFGWQEWLYLLFVIATYIICGLFLSSILGLLVYTIILLILSMSILKPQFFNLLKMAKKRIIAFF